MFEQETDDMCEVSVDMSKKYYGSMIRSVPIHTFVGLCLSILKVISRSKREMEDRDCSVDYRFSSKLI
jgi:hypothetical protein